MRSLCLLLPPWFPGTPDMLHIFRIGIGLPRYSGVFRHHISASFVAAFCVCFSLDTSPAKMTVRFSIYNNYFSILFRTTLPCLGIMWLYAVSHSKGFLSCKLCFHVTLPCSMNDLGHCFFRFFCFYRIRCRSSALSGKLPAVDSVPRERSSSGCLCGSHCYASCMFSIIPSSRFSQYRLRPLCSIS